MNSALKPVLPQPGVNQPGGQSSPAKGNVANHAVGLPQGAQNSLHHGPGALAVQNLTHHAANTPQLPSHAAPSMAPVSANMAQMAQNMSHHGNLSHITQNSVTPANVAASPSKSATTSAPLSLVQDKVNANTSSQPLALTRTPEKKEPDSTGPANGTIESPKSASNAPPTLKPQNPEPKQEKQDIAKTSPSTPKPPEKPSTPSTPQKPETPPVTQTESPAQPKVATANEVPEKSPSKPLEPKSAPDADVAPSQSDSKPVPESASDNKPEPAIPPKESAEPVKPEPTKEEVKEEEKKPQLEEKKEEKAEVPKQEEVPQVENKKTEKIEEKKEVKAPAKVETKAIPKSTLKLATVTPPMRKRRQLSEKADGATPAKKVADDATPESRTKRNRTKVQLYQSPTPEIAMATKLSASAGRSTPTKQNDDKLIVFYKNEYLAVRNAEGGFYVCQAVQNVYRTTRKIKIRWLSQDKADSSGETYKPDFYDVTDMECVLTTLSLSRASGGAQILKEGERARAQSILERALRAEQSGANSLHVTEEHPDGLDLSLYTDESQLEKKTRKRNSSKSSPGTDATETVKEEATPIKKSRTPKRSPKSVTKSRGKRQGSTPTVAPSSKTATALMEKAKSKTPTKRTPVKPAQVETPVTSPRKGRRAAKENKPATPVVPTPSTSTGKTSRSRRQLKK